MKKLLLLAFVLTINVCFAVRTPLNVWNFTDDNTLHFQPILSTIGCNGETIKSFIPLPNSEGHYYCTVQPSEMLRFTNLVDFRNLYPTIQFLRHNSAGALTNIYNPNTLALIYPLLSNQGYDWALIRYKVFNPNTGVTEGINNIGFSDYAACHPLYTCWGKNENVPGYDPNGQILPGDPNCPQNSFMNSGNTETFCYTSFEVAGERYFVVADFIY